MSPLVRLLIVFAVLLLIIIFLDRKYDMLKDSNKEIRKTYSFSRVQLAWWTIIILSSFVAIMTLGQGIPTLDGSTLILLSISSGTTAAAQVIDISNDSKLNKATSQNDSNFSFLLDLLSDGSGVSIQRFQAVVINVIFGAYMVITVLHNMGDSSILLDKIIPQISDNNLILLGISSGVYTTLKVAENKTKTAEEENKTQNGK